MIGLQAHADVECGARDIGIGFGAFGIGQSLFAGKSRQSETAARQIGIFGFDGFTEPPQNVETLCGG